MVLEFMDIHPLTWGEFDSAREDLIDLLIDCVASGASVGFLPPLSPADADAYWRSVEAAIATPDRVLLVAWDGSRAVGAVQLDFPAKPNALHRAEVIKLMVHTTARGRGVGRALMLKAEQYARADKRTLLVLDTREGDVAEQIYLTLGYQRAGSIPLYARSAGGELHTTVFMYRELL
jgi:ribosomal protein S18 acetylase RimI-like enzyme